MYYTVARDPNQATNTTPDDICAGCTWDTDGWARGRDMLAAAYARWLESQASADAIDATT